MSFAAYVYICHYFLLYRFGVYLRAYYKRRGLQHNAGDIHVQARRYAMISIIGVRQGRRSRCFFFIFASF